MHLTSNRNRLNLRATVDRSERQAQACARRMRRSRLSGGRQDENGCRQQCRKRQWRYGCDRSLEPCRNGIIGDDLPPGIHNHHNLQSKGFKAQPSKDTPFLGAHWLNTVAKGFVNSNMTITLKESTIWNRSKKSFHRAATGLGGADPVPCAPSSKATIREPLQRLQHGSCTEPKGPLRLYDM